jgi:hypothetical protein
MQQLLNSQTLVNKRRLSVIQENSFSVIVDLEKEMLTKRRSFFTCLPSKEDGRGSDEQKKKTEETLEKRRLYTWRKKRNGKRCHTRTDLVHLLWIHSFSSALRKKHLVKKRTEAGRIPSTF